MMMVMMDVRNPAIISTLLLAARTAAVAVVSRQAHGREAEESCMVGQPYQRGHLIDGFRRA
jgi:hypothetical protein